MKRPFKIAVAIPTFNRLSRLKRAIQSVEQQEFDPAEIEIYIVLANSASYDGTTEYIDSLKSGAITFLSFNRNVLTGEEVAKDGGLHNRLRLSEIVPASVDWVWYMGDDDYITQNNAIAGLTQVLKQVRGTNLGICHVSQARRSRSTGKILQGKLLDLCNTIGFHEMLGWMSSLVIRGDIFKSYTSILGKYH